MVTVTWGDYSAEILRRTPRSALTRSVLLSPFAADDAILNVATVAGVSESFVNLGIQRFIELSARIGQSTGVEFAQAGDSLEEIGKKFAAYIDIDMAFIDKVNAAIEAMDTPSDKAMAPDADEDALTDAEKKGAPTGKKAS